MVLLQVVAQHGKPRFAGSTCELMWSWRLGLGASNRTPGQGLYRGELGLRQMNSSTESISNLKLESMILFRF
jgi:hypothetical protein